MFPSRRLRIPLLVALLALCLLALGEGRPSAALAGPAAQAGAEASAAFTVHGSNGFTLNVKSERGMVTLVAADRRPPVATFSRTGVPLPANPGNVASSTYVAFGASPDPHEIDVPLGKVGRISVSFRPSGKVRVTELGSDPAARGCAGPTRIVRRLGTFSGTIEFRGEHGYTTVAARKAEGSIGTPLGRVCLEPAAGGGIARSASLEGDAVLTALSHRAGVQFEAVTTGAGVAYTASSVSPLGFNMVVSRSAQALAPKRSFAFDDLLHSARIQPPPPFSGKAGYELRQGPVWAGDLSVEFPGASVSLTGPDYRATLGY
jgi:hypothetical protein